MCGICGWLNLKHNLDTKIFERMNNIAAYRGPDDEGYLAISKVANKSLYGKDSCKNIKYDGSILDFSTQDEQPFLLLGHRRLSIIDLSVRGHQPMKLANEQLAITFNGEIYNYIEIRDELEKEGAVFYSNTDTEVILQAYNIWGEDCINHFNGMWGFAIWDEKNKKIFCSRDRLGAKPFYYSINDDEFIFSSEIKQLCENNNVKRVLNESVFFTQTILGLTDYSEETLIQDIKCLPGGYNLSVQLNELCTSIEKIDVYCYWDIDVSKKDRGVEKQLFEMLEDSIHLRTRSDVQIGVLLSGGLDSSCIVAEIADYYEKNGKSRASINTFTSCYEDFEEGNEQQYAHIVNEFCGVNENFIFPNPQDTYNILEKMVWHLEGNMSFSSLGQFILLEEISKTDVKVVINGQGADETQFGYERYYAFFLKDLLKKCKFYEFFKTLKNAKENSKLTMRLLIQYLVYFSGTGIRKEWCLHRMKPYIKDYTIKCFKKDNEVDKFINQKNLSALQYNELRGTQLTHILRMDDREFMAHSLESRVPFIDYRYIEKAVEIPEEMKIQGGYTKYLLRKHFENRLPSSIIWRKNKMGWPSPGRRWAERFDKKKVYDLFENPKTKKYFDTNKLKELFDKNPAAYQVESFMIAEIFIRKFRVEVPENRE